MCIRDSIGRMGQGWLPSTSAADLPAQWEAIKASAVASGRDPMELGLQPRLNISDVKEEAWREWALDKQKLGATRLAMYTMNCGLKGVEQHIERFERFMQIVKDLQD